MPVSKLRDFLDRENVPYVTISHSPAYTAQGIAATAHISGKELAKTVMLKVGGKMAMAVLPAPSKVDFDLIKNAIGTGDVQLATEAEFEGVFPGCEVGAMPPFGNLYGLAVFVADSLTEEEEIAFNAGSHTELIRLSYHDFARLVEPTVLKFTAC